MSGCEERIGGVNDRGPRAVRVQLAVAGAAWKQLRKLCVPAVGADGPAWKWPGGGAGWGGVGNQTWKQPGSWYEPGATWLVGAVNS